MKLAVIRCWLFTVLLIIGCESPPSTQEITDLAGQITNPLPSWNEGETRSAIVNFVEASVQEGSAGFIPKGDRIACFDNDGTLWAEQPVYFQLIYARDFIAKEADNHPEWANNKTIQSLLKGNTAEVAKGGNAALLDIIAASHSGMATTEFDNSVEVWLSTAIHPRFERPYNQLLYQPMLELLDYLRANGFKCFIVSGGGVDFLRVWADEAYTIPSHQIIGSSLKVAYTTDSLGNPRLVKTPEINNIDDGPGKPASIHQYIGVKPVFSVGNSDGDFEMLEYTKPTQNGGFAMIVHHTDSIREYAYDRKSHIGKLDKALDEAASRGWIVADMAKDWNKVFVNE
jgi:phosphoglycolate phosphatase-like HAD superfamily hydrolase